MRIGKHTTHPAADVFPLLEGQQFDALVEDIRRRGLDQDIVFMRPRRFGKGGKVDTRAARGLIILDGRNRLRACLEAGVIATYQEYTGDDPIGFVIAANLHRRQLNESQRAMAAAKIATLQRGRPKAARVQDSTAIATQGQAAKLMGISERSVAHARQVLDHGARAVIEAVERGSLAVSAASDLVHLPPAQQRAITDRVLEPARRSTKPWSEVRPGLVRNLVKHAKRVELAKGLNAKPLPRPEGPFDVLVADPPWRYDKREGDATSRGHLDYPDMTVDEICAAIPRALAGDDALLWLWTTNAHILEAARVLGAWGFAHKTLLTWDKGRIGLGDWLRGQTEHCILAVRGSPTFIGGVDSTLLRGDVREHSRKPESFYELVDRTSPGSKLELFSRSARPGWAAWGAELEKFNAA